MAKYTIIIEKGERYYSAYCLDLSGVVTASWHSPQGSSSSSSAHCPDLSGVVAAGATEEEKAELMKEFIEFHMDGLKEDKMPSQSRRSLPDASTSLLRGV